jgi:hypothetical protein
MPVPDLITTIGGDTANSYVSLTGAASYFEARLDGESWFEQSDDRKKQSLLKAAWRLQQMNWLGGRASSTQALAWPRDGVPKRDTSELYITGGFGYDFFFRQYGDLYASTEIPQQVKDAQCELAFAFLAGFADGEEAQVKSFSDDRMSVTFDHPRRLNSLPAIVENLLDGLVNQARRIRG